MYYKNLFSYMELCIASGNLTSPQLKISLNFLDSPGFFFPKKSVLQKKIIYLIHIQGLERCFKVSRQENVFESAGLSSMITY